MISGRIVFSAVAALIAAAAAVAAFATICWVLLAAWAQTLSSQEQDGIPWILVFTFPLWALAFLGIAMIAGMIAAARSYGRVVESLPWMIAGLGVIAWFSVAFQYEQYGCFKTPHYSPGTRSVFWCEDMGSILHTAYMLGPALTALALGYIAFKRLSQVEQGSS